MAMRLHLQFYNHIHYSYFNLDICRLNASDTSARSAILTSIISLTHLQLIIGLFKLQSQLMTEVQYMSSWSSFVRSSIDADRLPGQPLFPKSQIISFCTRSCPPHKQLLRMLPAAFQKYIRNADAFKQLIVLMYLLMIKGSQARAIFDYGITLVENLLLYRVWLLCGDSHHRNAIHQVYEYFDQWLTVFIPNLLKLKDSAKALMGCFQKLTTSKHQMSQPHQQQSHQADIHNYFIGSIDYLSIIFQALLIGKLREKLTMQSRTQFEDFLQSVYPRNTYKILSYSFHNEQTANLPLLHTAVGREIQDDLIRLDDLFLMRQGQETIELSNIIIASRNSSQLNLIPSDNALPEWVINSHFQIPQPVDLSSISSMKVIDLFIFLQLLQIYGSSPKIEVLNEYIVDEQFLDFFSLFLMGEQIAPPYQYGQRRWRKGLYKYIKQLEDLPPTDKHILCCEVSTCLLGDTITDVSAQHTK